MRNKELADAWKNGKDFTRHIVTSKKECPQCKGDMFAQHLDGQGFFEQLEEFQCEKCGFIDPIDVGYPRFMNRALTEDEGEAYYEANRPY